MKIHGTEKQRASLFWRKFNKKGPIHPYNASLGRCWIWTGSYTRDGYGHINWGGFYQGTHRVAWKLRHNSELTRSTHICHSCDNRACGNPSHLFAGTRSANMRDCRDKGRAMNGHGKVLPKKRVEAIRKMRESGALLREVAYKYKVHVSTVSAICTRRHHA